jgi:hypothetical protein
MRLTGYSPQILFFFLVCIFGLWVGRRVGWWFSKTFLYAGPAVPVVLFLLVWGSGTALSLRLAIDWLHPGTVLKVIGYGAGAYVSNPAFGLVREDTMADSAHDRHLLVNNLPLVVFIVAAIALAWFVRPRWS